MTTIPTIRHASDRILAIATLSAAVEAAEAKMAAASNGPRNSEAFQAALEEYRAAYYALWCVQQAKV